MTQNKQNGFLSNLADFLANEISKENQQVYEKAYIEAVDNGTSKLRVKMNKKASALLPLLAMGLSTIDLSKFIKTKKDYSKVEHKTKAQRKLERKAREQNT